MAGGNIVEEIFRMKSDTAQIIKELQTVKGVYKELTDEQQKQVIELGLLEAKEKSLLVARNKSTNPTMIIRINKELDENLKKLGALKEATDRFTQSESVAKKEADALGSAVSNAFKSTAIAGAANQIKGIETAAAGATKSGFNPLNNSVNQLSREFPAFAVSANIGFLAISNNLPIFFDALQRINKENAELVKGGGQTTSVLKQLSTAVFSFSTLLSIGVTLLTIFGAQIVKSISALFGNRDAFELNTEALKILNAEIEASEKNYDEFTKRIIANSLEIIKITSGLSELQFKNLTLLSKAQDEFEALEKRRRKAVAEGVQAELNEGKERVKFTTTVKDGIISIKNEETSEVIRLDKDMKDVIGGTFFGKESLTRTEKALQDKLDVINTKNGQEINQLTILLNEESKLAKLAEEDKSKVRQKFVQEDLIKRKSAADEIKQLAIDGIEFERGREEEQARFNTEKHIRAIDEANELEKNKKRISESNFQAEVGNLKANAKDTEIAQKQLNIDLVNLAEKHKQDIRKIEAENITGPEQAQLRLALETDLQRKLYDIDTKYQKITNDAIMADFDKTVQARINILNENKDFELFLLQDKYDQEKSKGKRASKNELDRLELLILNKKIIILQDKAEQDKNDLINKARKDGNEANAVEILAIENKLQNDIDRLRIKASDEDKKALKDRLKEYIGYFEQIIHAAIDATQKILSLKIAEVDGQIEQQTRRVAAAKDIAGRGNAEILELEQKRLDDLTKKKEKFVRDQQALAAVELVANTAIAISKAAAEGGVAAGVTIAAALIALVAGLASARSIASQAAYYDGGYTGDGNPANVSNTMDGKSAQRPYVWHNEEFVMNHKKTRQFGDIFQDVHDGKIDLREWKGKVHSYDMMQTYKPFTTSSPVYNQHSTTNIIRLGQMERKLENIDNTLKHLKLGLTIDENGFTSFMQRKVERNKQIDNLARLKP